MCLSSYPLSCYSPHPLPLISPPSQPSSNIIHSLLRFHTLLSNLRFLCHSSPSKASAFPFFPPCLSVKYAPHGNVWLPSHFWYLLCYGVKTPVKNMSACLYLHRTWPILHCSFFFCYFFWGQMKDNLSHVNQTHTTTFLIKKRCRRLGYINSIAESSISKQANTIVLFWLYRQKVEGVTHFCILLHLWYTVYSNFEVFSMEVRNLGKNTTAVWIAMSTTAVMLTNEPGIGWV